MTVLPTYALHGTFDLYADDDLRITPPLVVVHDLQTFAIGETPIEFIEAIEKS